MSAPTTHQQATDPTKPVTQPAKRRFPINPAQALVIGVLALSAVGMSAAIQAYGYNLRKLPIYPEGGRTLVATLPRETPNWKQIGTDRIESPEVTETLGTTNYVNRTFEAKTAPAGEKPVIVDLHVAYYTDMIDTVPHVPDRCLIGGGWSMSTGMREQSVSLDPSLMAIDPSVPTDGSVDLGVSGAIYSMRVPNTPWTSAPGQRIRLPRDVGPESPLSIRFNTFSPPGSDIELYAGYFFVANGGTVAAATGVRTLAFDLKNKYAFYMKIQVSTISASDDQEYAEIVASILNDLMPELMRCVPDWVDVELGLYPIDDVNQGSTAPTNPQ